MMRPQPSTTTAADEQYLPTLLQVPDGLCVKQKNTFIAIEETKRTDCASSRSRSFEINFIVLEFLDLVNTSTAPVNLELHSFDVILI